MATQGKNRQLMLFGIIALVLGVVYMVQFWVNGANQSDLSQSISNPIPEGFVVPEFNQLQAQGKIAFEQNCQACHGQYAVGSDNGPTFIHQVYVPGHHGDQAFYQAAAQGVPRHHWHFGSMPKIQDVTRDEVTSIIAYVRALQRANGIE